MDGDGDEPQYEIIKLDGNIKDNSSRDYTGKGRAFYLNGDIYEGDFKDGVRTGHGVYMYKRGGHRYDGKWLHNSKHGIGKMEFKKKGTYFGYFENNRRHGEGVFSYPNGDSYSGHWKWGKKHGHGTYLYAGTGMKIEGEWDQGKCTRGRWILTNGMFFEGDFQNNKPSGKGYWQFNDGNICNGHYHQKELEEGEEEEEEDKKKEEEEPKDEEDEEDADQEPEPDEDEDKEGEDGEKKRFNLEWHSGLGLFASAHRVKEMQALE